jgi:anti-sigma B factor antagonist
MLADNMTIQVRSLSNEVGAIDIRGEITRFSENKLMEAYQQLDNAKMRAILLNFTEMSYMNSSGIGLLITLLIRANRQGQKLVGIGLNEHFQRIFELTRLHEAIPLFTSEADALASLQ